jgi:hypothetical protein
VIAGTLLALQLLAVQPTVYHGRAGESSVRPPAGATDDVTIDGRLDEPVWRTAALLTGFSLYQPADGRAAPDSTEVLIWYSPGAIYFGIRAFAPRDGLRATLAERDRIPADDNVEIQLDTFDERRRAFVFIVNPLGVQADGMKSEAGGFIPGSNVMPGQNDLSSDFIWQSRGRVTDTGFEVEIRIPFSSLRYPATLEQRWGIQVVRNVQRSGYQETWTPARRASASFIAQEGWLVGMTGLRHGQVVELNPELTNTVNGRPCCAGPSDWRYTSDPRIGGNVKWGMGSNFVLNGTVRPDFSQVEADATQIAADARFALFYPEKRPFFVEGSEQFNVPNTLIYTRRIVQPYGAAKLTGKIGRTDVALLSALDDRSTTALGDRPLVDIVRLRQDFGAQNTAGILYSERVGGGRENRVAGGDLRLVFARLYYAQFQAVTSATRENGATHTAPMWEAVVDRTGRSFGFHYNIIGIQQEFRADNGFVPRTGYVQPGIANRYTLYGRPGGYFERWNSFVQTSGLWRYDDFFSARSLAEDKISVRSDVTLRGGWGVNVSPALSSYAFDPAAYAALARAGTSPASFTPFTPSGRIPTLVSGFGVTTPQGRRVAGSIGGAFGNDVDFLETSRVRRADYNASLDVRPSERMRVNATYVSTSFTRRSDGERTLSTRIPRLKLEYQVARPIFVRVIGQYEASRRAALRDPATGQILLVRASDDTYSPSTSRVSNTFRTDWLFSYRPTPGTVFFAGYGATATEPRALAFDSFRRTDDAFFIKASYLLRR